MRQRDIEFIIVPVETGEEQDDFVLATCPEIFKDFAGDPANLVKLPRSIGSIVLSEGMRVWGSANNPSEDGSEVDPLDLRIPEIKGE